MLQLRKENPPLPILPAPPDPRRAGVSCSELVEEFEEPSPGVVVVEARSDSTVLENVCRKGARGEDSFDDDDDEDGKGIFPVARSVGVTGMIPWMVTTTLPQSTPA